MISLIPGNICAAQETAAPQKETQQKVKGPVKPFPSGTSSTIAAKSSELRIPKNGNVWFSSRILLDGIGSAPVRIFLRNSEIHFAANGIPYNLAVPNATITFSPSAAIASARFGKDHEWKTVIPVPVLGAAFLSNFLFQLPDGLDMPGGIGPVAWQGQFYTDTPGVTLTWQWEAEVFKHYFSTYDTRSSHGVKPVDDSSSKCFGSIWDHAGAPDSVGNNIPCNSYLLTENHFTLASTSWITVTPTLGVPPAVPIADAGRTQYLWTGATVRLSGSKSVSPDNRKLTYRWWLVSVPKGSKAALTGADTVEPTFVADKVGGYTLQLIVNDGSEDSSPSTILVRVHPVEPDSATFSIPGSLLLFSSEGEVRVASPGRVQILRPPTFDIAAPGTVSSLPTISPRGDSVAWGFGNSIREDLDWSQTVRYVLGIYSLSEQRWKSYGDFDGISATAFSPDGTKVAFHAGGYRSSALVIFHLDTGTMTTWGKDPVSVGNDPSWSPDGKRLAVTIPQPEKSPSSNEGPELIVLLDLATGNVQNLAEGYAPSWSPTGDWIAYLHLSKNQIMLVHPDGTGTKIAFHLGSTIFSWRKLFGALVWSPDGKKLLYNELIGENSQEVHLLDLETARTSRMSKNGFPVFEWVALKK